jgi:hypothetical protein
MMMIMVMNRFVAMIDIACIEMLNVLDGDVFLSQSTVGLHIYGIDKRLT